MKNYIEKFRAMVEELRNHEKVQLLSCAEYVGASDRLISLVEDALGFSLDASLVAFYKQSNGLQIQWIHRDDVLYDPEIHRFIDGAFGYTSPLALFAHKSGCINILPIEQVFFRKWDVKRKGEHHEDYGIRAYDDRCFFDIYSRQELMAFDVTEKKATSPLVLGTEYWFDFDHPPTDFETYMDFLLTTKGIIAERRRCFSEGKMIEAPDLDLWSDEFCFKDGGLASD